MFPWYWPRQSVGTDMFRAGVKLMETAAASMQVVEHRTGLMRAAAADPLTGDYAELSLMVPEKVAAFSEAGVRLGQGWIAAQAEMVAEAQRIGAMMLSGRPPSAKALQAMHKRGARSAARSLAAAGEALAPIHKAATGNARRLKGKGATTRKPRKPR
jgi:hypothetical protein